MTWRRLWIVLGAGLLLAGIGLLWARFGVQVFLAAFGSMVC